MANNHYKHKNYDNLLRELQKKSAKTKNANSNNTDNAVNNQVTVDEFSDLPKEILIDYDLDNFLSTINDFNSVIDLYNYCVSQVDTEQQVTQDLLHAIEFCDNYKQRCKYTTQLHYCRKRRRQYKNAVIVLKPIVEFIQKDENKKCLNRLANVLGESRKTKKNQSNKSYNPRVLTNLEVFKNDEQK